MLYFYVEDEDGHLVGMAGFYQNISGSGALLYSNFGKALFVESNITQVSESLFSNEAGQSSSPLRIKDVRALIDDEDAGLESDIESHHWSAVHLFWKYGDEYDYHEDYWMLVDERKPAAQCIGLIAPVFGEGLWLREDIRAERQLVRMEDLEAQRRLIRIE